MTCEQSNELIHAFIDGELDLLRNVEIEHHLDECEACRAEHKDRLSLRSLIKGEAQYFDAPDLLKQRIKKQIARDNPSVLQLRSISRGWAAAAAVLLLALAGVLSWTIISRRSRANTDDLLAQDVVSSHVRSLMLDHLIDVPTSDTHTVKPWFNGKLDFAPEVKDLSAQGFPLIGGRLDYIGDRNVAALVYERGKHPINLFIWTSPGAADRPEQQFSRQGYNVIHWTKAGMSYWTVSDVNNTDLLQFVQLAR